MSSPGPSTAMPLHRSDPLAVRTPTVPARASLPPPLLEQPGVQTLAPVAARYRDDRRAGTSWWSPGMFGLLGLSRATSPPSTESLLRALHPDDRAGVAQALARSIPFSVPARVVRPDGTQRSVLVTGEPELEPGGGVGAVEGMCVDVTDCPVVRGDSDRVRALETEVEQMRAAMASRAAIEQAKGALMLLTGCTDQAAFDLLAHISSHTHHKVRDVAQAIVASSCGKKRLPDDVRAIIRDACPPTQHLR